MLKMKRFVAALVISSCTLIGFVVAAVKEQAFEAHAENVIESNTFVYNGTNASKYNGESIFVITDIANKSFASDDSYSFQKEMNTIVTRLKSVKTVVVDDNATEIYFFMLKYYPEATTLRIGKNVKTIHMNNYFTYFDYSINSMVSLSNINVENENTYFTVKDNVLYSTDMKILYIYPAGKKDTTFSIPDTVLNFAGKDMGRNGYLLSLNFGKSFGESVVQFKYDGEEPKSIISGLSSLQEITVDKDNLYLSAMDKVLYNKQQTKLIGWPQNLVRENITFPKTLQEIALETISNKDKVKTITLSQDMKTMWVWDFTSRLHYFENLEKISVPSNNQYFTEWKGGLYNKKKTKFYGFPQKSPRTTMEFPKGVAVPEIWERVYPNIEKVILPSTFTKFNTHEGGGFTVFYKMFPKLKNVQISPTCKNYKSIDGVVFNKKGTRLITYPSQKKGAAYIIPDTVTSLGDTLFAGCKNIKTLTISKNLKANQRMAFSHMMQYSGISSFKTVKGCKNYKVKDGILFNKKMTKLEVYPSYKKSTTYRVPDGVTDIVGLNYARNLKKLTLGKKVNNLPDFYTLKRLTAISANEKNPYYKSKNGILYNKAGTKKIYDPLK